LYRIGSITSRCRCRRISLQSQTEEPAPKQEELLLSFEFEFVVARDLVQIGTNEFFPQLVRVAVKRKALAVPLAASVPSLPSPFCSLIVNRSRQRSPTLSSWDRILAGWMALLVRPTRLLRSAIVLKPSTLSFRLLSLPAKKASFIEPTGCLSVPRLPRARNGWSFRDSSYWLTNFPSQHDRCAKWKASAKHRDQCSVQGSPRQ